jgi:hypothetical protein
MAGSKNGPMPTNAGVGVSGHGGVEGKLNESMVASSFEQADVRCNRHLVYDSSSPDRYQHARA